MSIMYVLHNLISLNIQREQLKLTLMWAFCCCCCTTNNMNLVNFVSNNYSQCRIHIKIKNRLWIKNGFLVKLIEGSDNYFTLPITHKKILFWNGWCSNDDFINFRTLFVGNGPCIFIEYNVNEWSRSIHLLLNHWMNIEAQQIWIF